MSSQRIIVAVCLVMILWVSTALLFSTKVLWKSSLWLWVTFLFITFDTDVLSLKRQQANAAIQRPVPE